MSGFCGRNLARRSSSCGHTNKWCATVSSRHGQRGQPESAIAPILFRCAFRGTCWHLRRKMVTCSSLLRRFILSLGLGVVICAKKDLPVVLFAHSFLQSSDLYCLIVCLAVFMVAVLFNWGHLAPCLASLSALSFPWMFVCPGIHWSVTLMLWSVRAFPIVCESFRIVELSDPCSFHFQGPQGQTWH